MTDFSLKLDLRAPSFGTPIAELYEEAINMAEYVDKLGFREVLFSEHHGSTDNYMPSPLVMAAAVAARTRQVKLRFSAMILPLHNPVRLAEDIAVLDQISKGRVELVFVGGYVQQEYDMLGQSMAGRGKTMDSYLQCLYDAWTGEPFEFNGQSIQVTPPAYQSPRPTVCLGGSSMAAVKRAARLADDCNPVSKELYMAYLEECKKLGKWPVKMHMPGPPFVHITDDVEADWQHILPHALHETNAYFQWQQEAGIDGIYKKAVTREDLQASGRYHIVTPQQAITMAKALGPNGLFILNPLMAGMDPKLGWKSIKLFETQVMPHL